MITLRPRAREPLLGHTRRVSSVSLGADGRRAATGTYDRKVLVWDLGPA
jgi:WD40 repeat protein